MLFLHIFNLHCFSAHPKTRLFITHGGLLSIQESLYFGVPILGMPVFIDQFHNVRQAVSQGMGFEIKWDDLSVKNLTRVIEDSLTDKTLV